MDGAMLARLGAVIFLALAGTAAVVEMSRQEKAREPSPTRTVEAARDPRRDEQRRCQQMGETAAQDAACLKVWAQTRDRFLGRTVPNEGR
ncbi:putative entry exclusion protein TrbK-alt [Xanthobacter oligotrophicus]|uniref:putative entry exclusion protein TrbK-alt n=1 Tax=Xanthobacter oligotrophicus TaxID=2607286 RepID=UPI0011F3AFD0|nr:putative entry exclusion protein TrbK-alt [Xanthobacter oligotrophicus]MCG5233822.1 putative entry exclusion protein TrbK-alt [Xanthobacter oligotrophicus]